jgi:hypothetical protein
VGLLVTSFGRRVFPKFFSPLDNSSKTLMFSAVCFISPSNIVLKLANCCSSRSTRGSAMEQKLGSDTNFLRECVTDLVTCPTTGAHMFAN